MPGLIGYERVSRILDRESKSLIDGFDKATGEVV
jgi:hypothetical protein